MIKLKIVIRQLVLFVVHKTSMTINMHNNIEKLK